MYATNTPRLGIDIGRVIISPAETAGDTSFLHNSDEGAMQTPPNEGAFAAIRALAERFAGRVWLVSKAGPAVAGRSSRWLRHWGFFSETGVSPQHLHFCRERAGKRPIAEALRLTHFIDDRADVLGHLRGVVPGLFLFGPQRRPAPAWVCPVLDWRAAEREVVQSLSSPVRAAR